VARLERYFGAPANPGAAAPGHLLLASFQAMPYALKMEALLARALQARGWRVSALANEATDPMVRAYHGRLLGADVLRLEDFLDFSRAAAVRECVEEALGLVGDLAAFKAYRYRNEPVALHALATLSAARPEGVVGDDPASARALGRLLRRSMLLLDAADAMFAQIRPTLVLGIEKGFVSTCETFYAALGRGVDFVQWVGCHEPESIMLKRYRPANFRDHPFSISDANWARLRALPWREDMRDDVMAEFERGYKGGAWFRYKGLGEFRKFTEGDALRQRLGLDPAKKTAVIYSHILNDANLFYGADLFAGGYEEWLVETVRAARRNTSVNWILKLHPANVSRNARLGYAGEYGELLALKRAFGQVPPFLHVVSPDDGVSPLSFFAITDWALTVRGTVGLELPAMGIPVLTAGTGRYAGKGFTVDSQSAEEYLQRVSHVDRVQPLDTEQTRLGVLYAYHVFRSRPARYGQVLEDRYQVLPDGVSHRDVDMRQPSLDAALDHPQVQAIVRFLASAEEDYLDV
jgi:hypothetical protein